MPRNKPSSAIKPATEIQKAPSSLPVPGRGKILAFLAFIIILTIVWSSGTFREWTAGPKTPLPRQAAGLSFGMTKADIIGKYPKIKKKFRSFNNDPQFQIVTLDRSAGLTDANSTDLLFFNDTLYFVSASWEGADAQNIPVQDWVKQFRRWNHANTGAAENLGADVLLKEWHFNDGKTEMTLRDLNYSNHIQRWQDLRDAANDAAQAAFAKYRIDAGN